MAPSSGSRQTGVAGPLVLALILVLLAGALLVRLVGDETPVAPEPALTSRNPSPDDEPADGEAPQSSGSIHPGDIAPDFTLQDLEGRPTSLSDWRGHPVLINFWATWCGPCELEMPAIQKAYEAHQGEGLVVLAVAVDDSAENVRRFTEKHGLGFQPLLDDGEVSAAFQVFGLPTSYFIDPNGGITDVHIGLLTESSIESYLAGVIAQE
jgi:peroxiredoxin